MKWNKLIKESEKVELDEGLKSKLEKLAEECLDTKKKVMSDRFRVYGYEGQALSNFWLMMNRVVSDLAEGGIGKDTVEDLERALTVIYYPDRHKTPGPTDPRDVR